MRLHIAPGPLSATPETLRALWTRWRSRTAPDHALRGLGPVFLDAGQSEAGWHRIQTYLACPRLFYWLYEFPRQVRGGIEAQAVGWSAKGVPASAANLEPEVVQAFLRYESPALVRGSLVHILVAHFSARWAAERGGFRYVWMGPKGPDGFPTYQERLVVDPLEIVEPELAAYLSAGRMLVEERRDERTVVRELKTALDAYEVWRGPQARLMVGLDVLGVETPMVQTIQTAAGPKRLSVRVDRIIGETYTRRVRFEDHKTSLTPELKATLDLYTISGQIGLLYRFGVTFYGPKFIGVYLNIIGVDQKRTMLHQIPAPPAPAVAEDVMTAIAIGEEGIAQSRERGYFPPVLSPYVCKHIAGGRKCDAWDLCTLGPGARR